MRNTNSVELVAILYIHNIIIVVTHTEYNTVKYISFSRILDC